MQESGSMGSEGFRKESQGRPFGEDGLWTWRRGTGRIWIFGNGSDERGNNIPDIGNINGIGT